MMNIPVSPSIRVGILQVPDYTPHKPLGGAEAVADQVARRLSETYEICVFHGYDEEPQLSRAKRHTDTLQGIAAFPINEPVRHHGVLHLTLTEDVFRQMAQCQIIIGFERVMENCPAPIQYAVLGGICYPHCWEIVESTCWDRLILPSKFLHAEIAIRNEVPIEKVRVIPNGLDQIQFSAGSDAEALRPKTHLDLLLPVRPDWGKGFERAFALARARGTMKPAITIHCFEQKSFLGLTAFYEDLRNRASGVNLVLHPWVERKEMPAIYRAADLTLCLGDLPEGFGMTAIESISCGTPVLATPVGFLRDILPAHHGLFHYDEARPIEETAAILDKFICIGRGDCQRNGMPYIAARYSEDTMMRAYLKLIEEDIRRICFGS